MHLALPRFVRARAGIIRFARSGKSATLSELSNIHFNDVPSHVTGQQNLKKKKIHIWGSPLANNLLLVRAS